MDLLKDKLIELELSLHRNEVRSSREKLDNLLADEFREIGASGAYFGKQEVLTRLPEEDGFKIEAGDFEYRRMSETIAHLTYKAKFFQSNGTLFNTSYRTSIWHFNGATWQMLFHQGTVTR
ncbi:DUF4440 domain-containing protein [Teredinibacter turnerae]|uniref:nuclear transport factor 2 family protein n=1 Tax=Teredinibacter turnerae TaxID=2426 RepID=UPI00048BE898|nr:DUF4440 domain-containing protein [Teredinibacter turnerae]